MMIGLLLLSLALGKEYLGRGSVVVISYLSFIRFFFLKEWTHSVEERRTAVKSFRGPDFPLVTSFEILIAKKNEKKK